MTTPRPSTMALVTLAALGIGLPVAAHAVDSTQEVGMSSTSYPLRGTWQVTVDPQPAPNGTDAPPFESTLAYNGGHTVSEATSRAGGSSAGVGAWTQTGPSRYAMTFQKYRFDSTGAYIGKTIVTEEIEVTGPTTYESTATTKVVDAAGTVVATFASQAEAVRLVP